jgi:dTDP-4-dehydrorhamnose 3,5-epimerase-like enzyme
MDEPLSPQLIEFPKIGNSSLGYISIAEFQKNVPFEIKRVYWTYYTPQDVLRGGHAHKELFQLVFAVSGIIIFETENRQGEKKSYELNSPDKGLYLTPFIWREIKFSHNAVLLCLASDIYKETDYIRDYKEFLKLQ